ncbi:MAG: response regulator transcription factor [Sandaracinaceae bacterium]|jgi:DNA-binding NarL/FixJ family response regulator|nr:response regulator transcription factor [Sandaracinaceae bacterium]
MDVGVTPKPRVLVVEDDPDVAIALRASLAILGYSVVEIVAEASRFDLALERARPDLVLLDIDLDGVPVGLELAERVPAHIPFVFVSAHSDPTTLMRAGARRPVGFLVKPYARAQLAATLEVVRSWRPPPPAMVETGPSLEGLSSREREIVEQLLAHKRVPAIAKALFISPHTVRNHLKNVFAKVGVSSQQELLDALRAQRSER